MSSSFHTTEKPFPILSYKFEYKENGETHTYPFKTGRRFYIDPTKCGNSARFANHSCEPNMIAKKWMANNRKEGFKAIGFVANKDIRKGAELTINYGMGNESEMSPWEEKMQRMDWHEMDVIGFFF
ncbi:Protein CBG11116 [Caenorhabditis briggsae]|uniref:Protein CBG11116 n=1 Tax=Caenorhabditis briggsae TaxID=6238 RepID=A8XCF9_CAEBR|nr:Protein CBG11116 [Caenorhabditis briggsae]CAP30326.1 Protein CBG11116 [Caenorhabditis briggsae]